MNAYQALLDMFTTVLPFMDQMIKIYRAFHLPEVCWMIEKWMVLIERCWLEDLWDTHGPISYP